MERKAFTMLELVFVIVVIGILASLAMPRIDRDIRQEAADNILSAIRYTQHMALMDDKARFAPINAAQANWQRAFWSFGTQGCADAGLFYYVASDSNLNGNINVNEAAIDPTNGLQMNGLNNQNCANDLDNQNGRSPNIFLTKKYGINAVNWNGCNPAGGNGIWQQHIAFDYMGRLHRNIRAAVNNYATYVDRARDGVCTIVFNFSDATIAPLQITIQPETGYAQIVGQPDS